MGKLVLMHNGTVIREYVLDKERTTVGRKPNNDIHLDDPTVSGLHAVFLLLQNVYVEDQNSTNGVLLNGIKITKRQLENNDVITIGKHELKFIDDKKSNFDSTIILSADEVKDAKQETEKKNYFVKVVSGPNKDSVITLTRAYTTLGKPGGQVAVIARRGDAYCLMQMGGDPASGSHPKINGKELRTTSVPLNHGDELEVGGEKLCFMQTE